MKLFTKYSCPLINSKITLNANTEYKNYNKINNIVYSGVFIACGAATAAHTSICAIRLRMAITVFIGF